MKFLSTPLFLAQGSYLYASSIIPAIVATSVLLIFLLVGCVVLFMSLRHAGRSREMLHKERLKSIDAGMPWQDTEAETSEKKFMHNAFWISFWMIAIGCGAPFTAASSAMDKAPFESQSIAIAAWLCAASASIGAVICAAVLMIKSRCRVDASRPVQQSLK